MNRLCSNKAEDQLSKMLSPLSKKDDSTPAIKVNFKNCLATVSRHLEEIMFVPVNCVKGVIQQIVSSISRYRQKVRPNRSYLRKSMKPIKNGDQVKQKKRRCRNSLTSCVFYKNIANP